MKRLFCTAALLTCGSILFAQNIPKGTHIEQLGLINFLANKEEITPPQNALGFDELETIAGNGNLYIGYPWAHIVWSKNVWRTIDVKDSKNAAFSNGNNVPAEKKFISILIRGFFDGRYDAFSTEGSGFSTKLSKQDFIALLSNKQGSGAGEAGAGLNPDDVSKFMIKESWLCLDSPRILVTCILGIAPVRQVKAADETHTDQPLFWLFYPDVRNYLAQQTVYESKENGGKNTWRDLLESRNFSSRIDKIGETWHRQSRE